MKLYRPTCLLNHNSCETIVQIVGAYNVHNRNKLNKTYFFNFEIIGENPLFGNFVVVLINELMDY